jgi:hypothetical protein
MAGLRLHDIAPDARAHLVVVGWAKANGSRECAIDGVPTIFSPLKWWARRKRAFTHLTHWIASLRSPSSGARSRDPLAARNDG